jgi:DNA-binding response OmpR family regulator
MNLNNSNFGFCQACGESVETHRKLVEGRVESRCVYCGLVLERRATASKACDRVIAVDDSQMLCDVLSEILVQKEISREVKSCRDGREFITEFTQSLLAKRPPNFLILDVEMPIVNGIHAALAARAIEKGFGIQPVPIIFFSVRKCDEDFRKVLNLSAPAAYLNKATASNPEMIGKRLSAIMRQISAKAG